MKFRIVTPNASEPIQIESKATTWGALKIDIEKAGISVKSMIGILRATQQSLDLDNALIPQDHTGQDIFLFPNDIKSGIPRKGESREEYNARRRAEAAVKRDGKTIKPVKKVANKKAPIASTVADTAKPVKKANVTTSNAVEELSSLMREIGEDVSSITGHVKAKVSAVESKLSVLNAKIENLEFGCENDHAVLKEEWKSLQKQLSIIRKWRI